VDDFTGGDGDAVLDAEQQRALLLCKSEAEVVSVSDASPVAAARD
jgi:hypothetical protein